MRTDAKLEGQIRKEIKGKVSHREIQKRYKVGLATISRIRNRTEAEDNIETGKTIDVVPTGITPASIGVVAGDAQVPYHDPIALELFFSFCNRVQPDWIDLNGDWFDFYQISRFDKDPRRMNKLQEDLNVLLVFLRRLREENPQAVIWYEKGNHEDRLKRYLWGGAKALACLDCLRLENLLHFEELGIVYVDKWRREGDLYITHGTVVRKNAGYSARAHYDKYGVTMIHNHTHRDGKFTRRTLEGHKAVWENYCLCDLEPEYCDFPDWTQGFSKVTMVGRRPYVEQIPIIQGQYIYGGKMWAAE